MYVSVAAATPVPDPLRVARASLEPLIARGLRDADGDAFSRCATEARIWASVVGDSRHRAAAELLDDLARIADQLAVQTTRPTVRQRKMLASYIAALRTT